MPLKYIPLIVLGFACSAAAQSGILCSKVMDFDKSNYIFQTGNRLIAKPEFDYYWGISSEDSKYLDELQFFIKKYKVNIITLPIPYQAALYVNSSNNPAPKKYDPAAANKNYTNQIVSLMSHGLNPINLSKIATQMPKDTIFFALRDHHWTGPAMELVATELKKKVDKMALGLPMNAQTTLTRSTRDYNGSIADELQDSCGYKFPQQEQRTFYDLSIKSDESLLGESNSDVVMVGDSFSIPYFGFDKVVSDKLKTPVSNFSINGGGCCASINGLFAGLKPSDPKPKLVIWTALMVLTNSNEVRELKPSIYQAYENTKPLKEIAAKQSISFNNNMGLNLDKGARYFVKIAINGPKTEELHFNMNYGNSNENIDLYRKTEMQSPTYETEFFYELKPGVTNLKSITGSLKDKSDIMIGIYKYN